MKNLKYLVIVLTLVFAIGCENDSDELPPAFQDATWVTSIVPGNEYTVKVQEQITFRDLSQSPLSHEFIIEEGNKYLKKGFDTSDSLPLFINKDLDLISTEKDAHVLFLNPGINKVKLRNTFKDSIIYRGRDTIYPVLENGVWVIENEWEVDVFAKLKPAFKVLQDGVEILSVAADQEIKELESDSWPIVDVEVNRTLTFVDLSTDGRPNGRSWRIAGTPAISNDSIAEIAFLEYGTTKQAGRIASTRVNPRPDGTVWKLIPLKVRVVSSSAPFEILSEINEDESEKLSFQVAGIIDAASLSGQNGNFTVNVTNATSGFNQNIAVQSITVNNDDGTVLELTLSEPIYNTDVITVSYAGGGIQSTDERLLNAFSNKIVNPHFENLAASDSRLSFEVQEDRGNGGNTSGWWTQHQLFFGNTTEVTAPDGIRVIKYNVPDFESSPGNSNFWGPGADLSALVPEAGTYRMSIKFYKPSSSSVSTIRTITNPSWRVTFWDFSASNDNWITVENDIVLTGSMNRLDFQMRTGDNSGVTGEQTFYIDDVQIKPIEERP